MEGTILHRPLIGLTCFTSETAPAAPPLPAPKRSTVNQSYVEAIVGAGGTPMAIPLGLDEPSLRHIYDLLDGLLLPGGVDVDPRHYGQPRHANLGLVDEARDAQELALLRWALDDDLPTLGICRGIQVLAVAAGGTLVQDIPSQRRSALAHEVRDHGTAHVAHEIEIERGTRLASILGTSRIGVNTFHHQAVDVVPPPFAVTARSDDGIVEGIEASDRRFTVGVQCHPEGLWNTSVPEFARLFAAFVEEAARPPLAATG